METSEFLIFFFLIFLNFLFILILYFFFLMETSEQHTETDVGNFVYSPTGFV